ncbi:MULTISPECIES: oligosaccharide flippase family protein [Bacteroides]|jgi:O-antigen/teichoic acid export membrane protein|uniref:oligosaccharide flippase family protein n=1 Tax=Bacteroides TaxID=816 RepID=UPI0018A0F186|nr:oligosaccharide flippase family protein [Bacteroides nordii]
MSDTQTNNKQIAKNAAALYFRMIITMLVGLYTSRVILNALGVEDFGVYNVVGGFVSMFALISGALQNSVIRFLMYEHGAGDKERLKVVFSMSFFVMLGLGVLIVLATETVGLWYLYNKMVIPADRLTAAFWCFQFSVCSFILSVISTPYSSSIIANEKMGVYAYISILDAGFKLLICYAVMVSPIDRLITYAMLLFFVSAINQIIYLIYCKRKFQECTLHFIFNRTLFKQMFGFAGWNFIGSSAIVLRSQGANLLLNAFGGPIVNAANGIANSICNIVSSFVTNFTQAFNPQITKRYAAAEYESLMKLLVTCSKYSYFLMYVLALPLFFNAHYILKLWLGIVPDYTVVFVRWILVFLLAESLSRPIVTAKTANGNIRNYQIIVGLTILLVIPIAYLGLKIGLPVTFVAFANALVSIIVLFIRIYLLKGNFPFWSSRTFIKRVICNVLLVTLISCVLPSISYHILPDGLMNFLVTSIVSFVSSCITVLCLGCSISERKLIFGKIKHVLHIKD